MPGHGTGCINITALHGRMCRSHRTMQVYPRALTSLMYASTPFMMDACHSSILEHRLAICFCYTALCYYMLGYLFWFDDHMLFEGCVT